MESHPAVLILRIYAMYNCSKPLLWTLCALLALEIVSETVMVGFVAVRLRSAWTSFLAFLLLTHLLVTHLIVIIAAARLALPIRIRTILVFAMAVFTRSEKTPILEPEQCPPPPFDKSPIAVLVVGEPQRFGDGEEEENALEDAHRHPVRPHPGHDVGGDAAVYRGWEACVCWFAVQRLSR